MMLQMQASHARKGPYRLFLILCLLRISFLFLSHSYSEYHSHFDFILIFYLGMRASEARESGVEQRDGAADARQPRAEEALIMYC